MERTKGVKTIDSDKPKWQKVGGGSLRIGNRIIKPGQTFQADSDEISESFKKFVIPVGGNSGFKIPKQKEVATLQVKGTKTLYTIQPHGKSLFLFDVVDSNGKVQNEKSLKKEVAEQFVESLNT